MFTSNHPSRENEIEIDILLIIFWTFGVVLRSNIWAYLLAFWTIFLIFMIVFVFFGFLGGLFVGVLNDFSYFYNFFVDFGRVLFFGRCFGRFFLDGVLDYICWCFGRCFLNFVILGKFLRCSWKFFEFPENFDVFENLCFL